MQVVESGNVTWSRYCLALTGVHALAMVIAAVGRVSGLAAGVFCLMTLAVSVLAHI